MPILHHHIALFWPVRKTGGLAGAGFPCTAARHPFMGDIDWDKLQKREIPPPFIPDLTGAFIMHPPPRIVFTITNKLVP